MVEGGQNGFVHVCPAGWMADHRFHPGPDRCRRPVRLGEEDTGEGFAAAGNKLVRSTGAITAIAGNGYRLRAWSLEGVYPIRWTGPSFSVNGEDPLTEELEIAHHGFRSSAPGR